MIDNKTIKEVPAQPQPEEEEQNISDDEPMDQEVLNALKKNTINDDFTSTKEKSNTQKAKKGKKTNNKKGNFLDFAQEKGIEFKLQYEDKEDQRKNYYQKDNKNFQGKNYYNNNNYKYNNNNQNNFQGKNYHKNNFKYNNNKKFGYNNFNQKPKNNKFDQANMMMGNMNPQGNYVNYNMNYDPFFKGEKTCEEIIAYIFSQDFLNKELYLRKRISEEGMIEINNLMMFNK